MTFTFTQNVSPKPYTSQQWNIRPIVIMTIPKVHNYAFQIFKEPSMNVTTIVFKLKSNTCIYNYQFFTYFSMKIIISLVFIGNDES
jgi:hypothetical protein